MRSEACNTKVCGVSTAKCFSAQARLPEDTFKAKSRGLARQRQTEVAQGIAESLVTLFFGFGCLTVAWLCVTLGLWRRS
jgi:hypothetical protein